MRKMGINIFWLLLALIIFMNFCDKKQENKATILAEVGNKSISVNEFIRRAEYTLRPNYCRRNTNVEKKIILNSLIAEKIMAIENKGTNRLKDSKKFQDYIKGRREQAMRQILYNQEVASKIELDSAIINKYTQYADREYDISYLTIPQTPKTDEVIKKINSGKVKFDSLIKLLQLDSLPKRKVTWSTSEHPLVLDSLYSNDYKKNQVIGPIPVKDLGYTYLKVNSWTENLSITKTSQYDLYDKVSTVLKNIKRQDKYENYIQKVMKNKDIKFNRETFFTLTEIFGPVYLKSQEEKEKLFKKGVWSDTDSPEANNVKDKLKSIKDEILFTVSGNEWTVDELLQSIRKHPLVFRKKEIRNKEFGFQLQMAIIDLVRDKYLTNIAYDKGLDQRSEVKRQENLWKDYLYSLDSKYKYLKKNGLDSLFSENHLFVIENHLNAYVDSLQNVYSNEIFVNTKKFNQLDLSRIDMVANYSGLPFSRVVPSFPVITSGANLNYGNKIQ